MPNKKRIAIVSSSWPPNGQGGVTSAHFNLAQALKHKQIEVKAFTFKDIVSLNSRDLCRRAPSKLINGLIRLCLAVLFRLTGTKGLRYQLFDIISSCSAWRLNRSLRMYNPDIVIFPDHGAPALYVKKNKNIKFLMISHHNPARFLDNMLIEKHSELDTKLSLILEDFALKKIDHVICPSRYMKKVFQQTYKYEKNVSVLANIVDTNLLYSIDKQDVRNELSLKADAIIVYIPAAGSELKGSDYVFELVRRISRFSKKSVGFFLSGPIEEKLQKQLKMISSSVPIFMPGTLTYGKNISYVKSCSLCVSPTLIENFGMALVESIACGVPVVSFNVGGNEDVIANEISGFLVPLLDIESLIEKSMQLINNSSLLAKLSRTSITLFERRFHPDSTIDKFLAFLE